MDTDLSGIRAIGHAAYRLAMLEMEVHVVEPLAATKGESEEELQAAVAKLKPEIASLDSSEATTESNDAAISAIGLDSSRSLNDLVVALPTESHANESLPSSLQSAKECSENEEMEARTRVLTAKERISRLDELASSKFQ